MYGLLYPVVFDFLNGQRHLVKVYFIVILLIEKSNVWFSRQRYIHKCPSFEINIKTGFSLKHPIPVNAV